MLSATDGSFDLNVVANYLLQAGPAGLFALALLMGWVFSKSAHEELKADRDEWRRAYEASDKTREELKKSVDTLIE